MGQGRPWLALVLAALFVAACGKSGEKKIATVPVKGKVVFVKGGDVKVLASRQARIEFQSVDQPGLRAVGPIEEDGSFTVATVAEGAGGEGLVAGTHRVRLDLDDRDVNLVAPQFLDFAKSGLTVKVPSEQPLEIKVFR